MHTRGRLIRFIPVSLFLIVASPNLGAECGIPGMKPKGMKVTGIRSLESIVVRTKEPKGLEMEEYTTVWLLGFTVPNHMDSASRAVLSDILKNKLLGQYVTLEWDDPKGGMWLDGQGHTAAYVFVDGKMINEELIREGLGRAGGRYQAARYRDRLKQAEKEAREARRGMWANYEEKPGGGEDEDDLGGDYEPGYDGGYGGGEVNVYEPVYEDD